MITSTSNSYRPDEELEEQEEEDDGSREDEGLGFSETSRKRGLSPDPLKKRTNIEEHWSRYGQFELTSVLQVINLLESLITFTFLRRLMKSISMAVSIGTTSQMMR